MRDDFKPKGQLTICDISENSLKYSQQQIQQCKEKWGSDVRVQYKLLKEMAWDFDPEALDLVLSSMSLHTVNFLEKYLEKVHLSLVPDGTLLGVTLGPETLDELRISYILAENQRYGGLSPHVSPFVELSDLGHALGHTNFKMPTVVRDTGKITSLKSSINLDIESYYLANAAEVLHVLQQMGENSALVGSRKAVYRELLISALSIYNNLFSETIQGKDYVKCTIQFVRMIGWKEHVTQPKPKERVNTDLSQLIAELQGYQDEPIQYGNFDDQEQDGKKEQSEPDTPKIK